jgi:hypothetical protein
VLFGGGETGRQIYGGGCFAYSAFLVGDSDDSSHSDPGGWHRENLRFADFLGQVWCSFSAISCK